MQALCHIFALLSRDNYPTCAGLCGSVESGGKTAPGLPFGLLLVEASLLVLPLLPQNPPRQPHSGTRGCETGFRSGFSQLTFSLERGKYEPSGFPLSHMFLFSRFVLGMKETCKEKL
jgi:hypothetical protein